MIDISIRAEKVVPETLTSIFGKNVVVSCATLEFADLSSFHSYFFPTLNFSFLLSPDREENLPVTFFNIFFWSEPNYYNYYPWRVRFLLELLIFSYSGRKWTFQKTNKKGKKISVEFRQIDKERINYPSDVIFSRQHPKIIILKKRRTKFISTCPSGRVIHSQFNRRMKINFPSLDLQKLKKKLLYFW